MGLAPQTRPSLKSRLWERVKAVVFSDVGVLVRGLDRGQLERVERVLLEADFGPVAFEVTAELEERLRRGELQSADAVRQWLAARFAGYLRGPEEPGSLALGDGAGPGVILLLGVNGAGKTTVAAKVAHRLLRGGRSVLLAAADTYRAAAAEQLQAWATRLGVPCVAGAAGSDPAAVAFDAIDAATARRIDAVLVDTAGRLHTQADLVAELTKISRVVGQRRPGAPHEALLVLDGTVGQNALQQGRAFSAALPVTGLVLTKLDGTAKGGAVVRLERELRIPIRFLGVGEGLEDLEVFDPDRFVDRLLAD